MQSFMRSVANCGVPRMPARQMARTFATLGAVQARSLQQMVLPRLAASQQQQAQRSSFWMKSAALGSVFAFASVCSAAETVKEIKFSSGQVIQVVKGDLTQEKVDAIVNPANGQLQHGGGAAAAIARRGGSVVVSESEEYIKKNGPIATGDVCVTSAGDLPCQHVIHAVGPVWKNGHCDEDQLLRLAVWNSLAKAESLGLKSISLPAISSGIYGFPKERCAALLFDTVGDYFMYHPKSQLKQVRFTNFDDPTYNVFLAEAANYAKQQQQSN